MPQHRNAGGPFLIFEPGLGVTGSLQCDGKIAITSESSTPPQPADGFGWLYTKNDGKLYWRSYDVGETDLTGAGAVGAELVVGTGASEDIKVTFDGNAQDFRIGINDNLDHLEIGGGTTMGSNTAIRITAAGDVVSFGTQTPSDGQVLYWDQTNSRIAWKTVAAGASIFFLLGGEPAYDANQTAYIGFAYATALNDYPSPWPRYDAVGTISLG